MTMKRWRTSAISALMLVAAAWAVTARQTGQETSPWLGVYLADAVDGGIRIVAVVPGGPASLGGLRVGDLLLEASDAPIADQAALERVLAGQRVGQTLSFGVLRDGRTVSLQITPAVRPATVLPPVYSKVVPPVVPAAPRSVWPRLPTTIGLDVVEITSELRRHYGAGDDRGVLVVSVKADGAADRAGIRVGDVLVQAGRSPLTGRSELDLALLRWDARRSLPLTLLRKREPLQLEIPPREPVVRPAAVPAPLAGNDRRAQMRRMEAMIATLERRLETLRRELEQLSDEAPEPAASPKR